MILTFRNYHCMYIRESKVQFCWSSKWSFETPFHLTEGDLPRYLIKHSQAVQEEAKEWKRCFPDLGLSARRCYPRRFREETKPLNVEGKLLRSGPGVENTPVKRDLRIMYNRKMVLMKKLNKAEEAIKMLSTPKLFVKLDIDYKLGNIYTFIKPLKFMSDSFGVQHSASS